MQSICRSLIHRGGNRGITPLYQYTTQRCIASSDRWKPPRVPTPPTSSQDEEPDDLFSPENIKELSSVEVARMRVTYGLLKEHVRAVEQNLEDIDPQSNPMLDPRSFDSAKLPKLPKELLSQFRKELPADVAAVSRPVSTQGIWDALTKGDSEMSPEVQNEHAAEWAIVDERTMDPKQFSRMQRQSFTNTGDVPFRSDTTSIMRGKRKKPCPLKDERGRVSVDFRALGTLKAYLSEGGKILPKRKSGLSAKSQRKVSTAIKTARTMALIHPEPNVRLTYEQLVEIERNL